MRLLICTQVVDQTHPILGFFHRWLVEFAKHVDEVQVICLQEGSHDLPKNVHVYSLGKEKGTSKLVQVFRFYRAATGCTYDAVFVHMNPEYVILGGFLWRLWGKNVGLWYVHKAVNLRLRIALFFVQHVFTASLESFRIKSSKVHILGHGIDTDFFTPDPSVARGSHAISVGRLTKSKRHDLAIEASARAGVELAIIGDGPERNALGNLARSLSAHVRFLGGLNQKEVRDEYRKAAFLIHTSETGSMDKVVLEALATDLPVITTSDVYAQFPVHVVRATSEKISEALTHPQESTDRLRVVREGYGLGLLVHRILSFYASA